MSSVVTPDSTSRMLREKLLKQPNGKQDLTPESRRMGQESMGTGSGISIACWVAEGDGQWNPL